MKLKRKITLALSHSLLGLVASAGAAAYDQSQFARFNTPIQIEPNRVVSSVVHADFDSDGCLDIATSYFFGLGDAPSVRIHNGDCLGNLRSVSGFDAGYRRGSLNYGPARMLPADLNGDGNIDLLSVSNVGSYCFINQGLGGGQFGPAQACLSEIPHAVMGPFKIVPLGDVNGDSRADFAASISDSAGHSLLLLSGSGNTSSTLRIEGKIPLSGQTYRSFNMIVGKFDFSGRQSIAYTDKNYLKLLRVNPDFTVSTRTITLPNALSYLLAGDFNGDGITDIAASGRGDCPTGQCPGMTIRSRLVPGGQVLFSADISPLLDSLIGNLAVVVADINSDGYDDIVTPDYHTASKVRILLARAMDRFYFEEVSYDFCAATTSCDQSARSAIAVADLNHDRLPDMLRIAANSSSSVALRVNPAPSGDANGDHTISNFDIDAFVLALVDRPAYLDSYNNAQVTTCDINRDGLVNNFDIEPMIQLLMGGNQGDSSK